MTTCTLVGGYTNISEEFIYSVTRLFSVAIQKTTIYKNKNVSFEVQETFRLESKANYFMGASSEMSFQGLQLVMKDGLNKQCVNLMLDYTTLG
jgi:hypothetical protein